MDGTTKTLWSLDAEGFKLIKSFLPPLKEDSWKSEKIIHDFIASAVLFGPWIHSLPKVWKVFTDHELRCLDDEYLPEWLPKPSWHRPDGYWCDATGSASCFALEVELNHQRHTKYQQLAEFYAYYTNLKGVVWVVQNASVANSIGRALQNEKPEAIDKHHFLPLSAYSQWGWQAPFILGSGGPISIATLLRNSGDTRPSALSEQKILNFSKTPHKSGPCDNISNFDFSV